MEKCSRKSIITTLLTIFACMLAVVAVFVFIPMSTKPSAEDEPLTAEQLSLVDAAGWFGTATITAADYKQTSATLSEDRYGDNGIVTLDVEIGTAKGLAYLARLVNQNALVNAQGEIVDGADNLAVYNVILTADIDLAGKLWIPIGTTSRGSVESGHYATNLFRGTVDGQGHKITNLSSAPFYAHMASDGSNDYYIDCGDSRRIPFEVRKNEEYCWGLFATTADADMKNITVEGMQIDMGKKAVGSYNILTDGVGALIGFNIGDLKITNCVSGKTDKTDYIRNTATTGGLVGRSYSGKQLVNGKLYAYGTLSNVDLESPIVTGLTLNSEIYYLNNATNAFIMPYYEEDESGNITKLYYKSKKKNAEGKYLDEDGNIITAGNATEQANAATAVFYYIDDEGIMHEVNEADIKAAAEGETPTVKTLSYANYKNGSNKNYNPTIQNLITNNQTEILGKIYTKVFKDMFGAGVTPTTYSTNNGVLPDEYVLGTIEFTDCKNYINVDAEDKFTAEFDEKKAGMLGFLANAETVKFENCENHGDMTHGLWLGGLTNFQARYFLGTEDKPTHRRFEFINCHNTGNMTCDTTKTGGAAGGLLGVTNESANSLLWSNDYTKLNIVFKDCTNTGTIISNNRAGGIAGGIHLKAAEAKIENCYNYGMVSGKVDDNDYGGGLVGQVNIYELPNVRLATVKDKYNATVVTVAGNTTASYVDFDTKFRIIITLDYVNSSNAIVNAGGYVYLNYTSNQIAIAPNSSSVAGNMYQMEYDFSEFALTEHFMTAGDSINDNPFKANFSATGGNLGTKADGSVLNNIGYLNIAVAKDTDSLSSKTQLYGNTTDVTATKKYSGVLEPVMENGVVVGFEGTAAENESDTCSVIIPASVTKIAGGAFAGVSNLTSVTFEEGSNLKEIGDWAFAGCEGLASVTLPTGLEKVGKAAFANCTNLKAIVLPDDASGIAFGDGVLVDTEAPIIVKNIEQYGLLKESQNYVACKDRLTYVVPVEYYDFNVSDTEPVGTEVKLYGKDYRMSYDEATKTWALNSSIDYVGLNELGGNTATWYTDNTCATVADIDAVTTMLAKNGVQAVKLYTRILGVSDSFIAKTGLVYDGTEYSMGAINSLLSTNSKKVTTETVEITKFNDSTVGLPTSIRDAGTYTVTITPAEGEATTLTITIAKANFELSTPGAFQWRVNGSTLSDGPVYLVDGNPTLVKPEDTNYTVEAAIESLARVRGDQTLTLAGTGFTANVKEGSSAQGSAIGTYTTTYTLTADSNHTLSLNGTIVNGSARGLTVTPDGDGWTVTKVWYIVAMGNWLVDANGNDYAIVDRVYGSSATFVAPGLAFGNDQYGSRMVYTLTRSGYDGLEFTAADFARYLNNTIPVGSYTLRVSAPEVTYYEEYDEEMSEPVGEPVVSPAFIQDVTFEVTAATLSFDQGIGTYLNGSTFSYFFGEETVSEANALTVTSINGALENIYRNLPRNDSSYWGSAKRPVIEVNLVSDKTNIYSDFTRPAAIGVYDYYYRIHIENYNIVDTDNYGAPLGFTLVAYGVVDLPALAVRPYNGATQVAFIVDSTQYRVVKNDGGIDAGTYDVVLELIHPECYIWYGQELNDDHSARTTIDFVIDQAVNAWTRLPNIVNWSYDSFDADVNRIRAVPLYLNTGAELYFKVATDEEGANVINGLGRVTVDRNGKITDTAVIELLNGLTVGRYYLVSVVDETANYSSMIQSIGFNVTKAPNYWASGESDLVLPSWVVGDYDPAVNTIAVNPEHGVANIKITDINGVEYYNSVTGVNNLAEAPVGKYLLVAWVDASDNFEALADRTFTIEVLETIGLPWWGTLLIVIGVLLVVAIVLFVLWKKGVFQILTGKLVLAIRTKATVDATIAAVRASKKADEAKAAIAAAKAKERASERKAKAAAERALPVEERAAALEAKAQAAAAKADKMRARAEAMQARADRMKEEANGGVAADAQAEPPATEQPEATNEAPVTEQPANATETAVEQPTATEAEAAATATEKQATTNSNNRPSKKSGTKK